MIYNIPEFKSDHSIVTISMHFTNEQRGPGYFKINNSLLLQSEYQKQIKNTIIETATNNVYENQSVLWKDGDELEFNDASTLLGH